MNISNLIIYFITGGLFTTIIVALEESGQRALSGLATLIPVFTLVVYFSSGKYKEAKQLVSTQNGYSSGRLYRGCRICLRSHNAILVGLAIFFVLALIYIAVASHFGFFR